VASEASAQAAARPSSSHLPARTNTRQATLRLPKQRRPRLARPSTRPALPTLGRDRLIYPLAHHPRDGQPVIRQALPTIQKAFGTDQRADLSTLTNHELHQLKAALQAVEQTASTSQSREPLLYPLSYGGSTHTGIIAVLTKLPQNF
jgi:hypothetical protein